MLHQHESAATPTFSIVIETDNLAIVDLDVLFRCLDSLAEQGPLLHNADGIFIVDGGVVPVNVTRTLQRRYPWITVIHTETNTSYMALKFAGALQTMSDIIVFCDGDVVYEKGWLSALLAAFDEMPEADVVAGETSTPITGPYSLAFALSFNFPRLSKDDQIVPSNIYWANNVAIRRYLLDAVPLPDPAELYRGQNLIHSMRLRKQAGCIVRQPRARSWHSVIPPQEIMKRYFTLGRDAAVIRSLTTGEAGAPYLGAMEPDPSGTGVLGRLCARLFQVGREQPSLLLMLPLASPFLVGLGIAYAFGRLAGSLAISSLTT